MAEKEKDEEEEVIPKTTLDAQFFEFGRLNDKSRSGLTITLYNSDYWMRQAKILDDRIVTMTDTGILFFKFSKTEITYDEWLEFLSELCELKNLDEEEIKETLTECGLPGITYCNATFDSFLCWPPTEAGATVFQNCPEARLSDTTQLAFRQCGEDGLWLGRKKNESGPIGWTNYTPCFPTEVQNLFGKVYDDEANAEEMFNIAQNTRNMETFGFTLSLITLLISLYLFCHFRSLKNIRTRIHTHLFLAMTLQVLVRLVLYIDQAILRVSNDDYSKNRKGLDNIPYVCEGCYILLEYGTSAMFCWMLLEGLYLYNIVTDNALRESTSFRAYIIFGWTTPFFTTGTWATITSLRYRDTTVLQCWYGYNFQPEYWICEGPRVSVVLINFFFLFNILRVLIGKLNQSENSEIEKVKKAVRAALVLLPLLGITNILNMIEPPLNSTIWKFALWSYSTHFLRSFQGFFIALIYCFMNGEVRQVVEKSYTDWKEIRADKQRMRQGSRTANRSHEQRSTNFIRPFRWIRAVFKKHCRNDDVESNVDALCLKYRDPKVLDNLPTIRFDAETNATDV